MKKFKNIFNWDSFKKGIIKGYSIPLLPDNINKVYNSFIFRVLRVVGGFCVVLILTNSHTCLPKFIT